jgi:hypothetical protein
MEAGTGEEAGEAIRLTAAPGLSRRTHSTVELPLSQVNNYPI